MSHWTPHDNPASFICISIDTQALYTCEDALVSRSRHWCHARAIRRARVRVADWPPHALDRRAQGSRTRLRARQTRYACPKLSTGGRTALGAERAGGRCLVSQRSAGRARRRCSIAVAFLCRPAVGMQPVARVRERGAEREQVQSGHRQRRGSRARLAPSMALKRGHAPAFPRVRQQLE